MNLLEILLLIFITYGLLAAGRKKTKKRPVQTAPPRDPALEEALREIREALRWPEPETKREARASADEEFHSLEQTRTLESRKPEFRSLEAPPLETSFSSVPEPDESPLSDAEPARGQERARFWLGRLRQREGVREAIVLAELLGPPRARRPWRPRIGSDHLG
ncbi:hypothetical protein [Rhodothermus marinus]|jgi:hypothetical protein|uniref:hypothetical protein n=1 Tax=Rhodothermus marinus TaxID=29549 RepID=UPI000223D83F|nr:hypothetical protein [Rhodothermus marinus]AEN72873.1 hypothetical protein Rhom172_0943 [Rhodothermus marinus SG0.5JP17-172]MBO2491654.1 hypothetical protein [Rhodothermus marinus]BBM70245.1 hypothetical protein RmaAA213_20910 [Rhodothermus marinus]BBM73232.1 hypothetical protein RmaAA338_20970 [Rhodothermus marinus]